MTELQKFLADDDAITATLREALIGDSVSFNVFCTKCGGHVTDAEPDASWRGGGDCIACPTCGPGTRIASGLILAGMM